MRLLFELKDKGCDDFSNKTFRPSARAIIIQNKKVYMVHSDLYDYYKFPGGGIEPDESIIDALIRETEEEAGLEVMSDSVKEYGCVHREQIYGGAKDTIFVQDNYYFFCKVKRRRLPQQLEDYEMTEKFTLELVEPLRAIDVNRNKDHGPKSQQMTEREARVLELLLEEGYFD